MQVRTNSYQLGDPWLDDQVEIDGTTGAIRACLALKARNNRLKVILSIGGGHGSQHFRQVAASPELRDVCADSARQLVDHYGLDGIDGIANPVLSDRALSSCPRTVTDLTIVDWEHPNGVRQCRDYISLLAKMRTYFPTPRYICTSAIPGHDWAYRQLNVLHASQYLDLINLMCYDFTTNMSAQTGHQAQLDRSNLPCTPLNAPSGKAAVTHLRTSGVPGHKILLGIPAYGRCFRGTTGVDQPFTRYVANERVIPYCDLPLPNSVEQVDRAAVAAYCFSEAIGFVTYDNPVTVMMKADFVKANRLAGLFYWEGTGDIDNPRSLVLAGYDGLFPA